MQSDNNIPYSAPIWQRIDGVPKQFPWLEDDLEAEICVVGGGITGAMCARAVAAAGHDVVLITDGAVGMGETARMMPTARADMNEDLRTLIRRWGEDAAVDWMRAGAEQLDRLEELIGADEMGTGFVRRDSFLFSYDINDIDMLSREFTARRNLGFGCSFVGRASARDAFAFDIAGGIMVRDGAAVLDPYRLAHKCVSDAQGFGAEIYENTKAVRIDRVDSERWQILTSTNRIIECERVVIAAGAACGELIGGVDNRLTTFTVASRPLSFEGGWPGLCVMQSVSAPDVSMALSPDRRIFAQGLASTLIDDEERVAGVLRLRGVHERRFGELEAGARYLFPALNTPTFELAQAGRVCRTNDGLPIIGTYGGRSRCYFAIPGKGGIPASMICADAVERLCGDREFKDYRRFSPERRTLTAVVR